MIQELLRSTLFLGTVMVNAVTLGTPSEPIKAVNPDPAPIVPVHREASSRIPGIPALRRMEAALPRLRIKTVRSGLASWYGSVFEQHRTANGEVFDSGLLTGASNLLPFGTRVKVTNLKNGRSVIVRVNDRGLLAPGRIIDLSSAAAEKIGLLSMGIAPVHLDVLAAAL